jgi:signal transduction histidine kinase
MPTAARLLAVDDEPRNLSLLEALLTPLDVTLEKALGGREAVELFQRAFETGGFDLVLLDVMMPEVDGLTALTEMRRATPAGERVPIVLVTALGAREDRLRGLEAGADDFLTKPLDPHEVRARVRTFLALRDAQKGLKARASELERLHRARAELTRMIVHDLKNPLAGVGSNLGWIDRRLRKRSVDDPELFEAVADARSGAERLVKMVGSLLEVEKAESGQLEVSRRPTPLRALLTEVSRRNEKAAEARQIRLDLDVAEDASAEIDPELTTRILENLVENATRYADEGGRIRLEAHVGGGVAELVVANTGPTIPDEVRERIFEKNHTTENRAARGNNLGLGLYFCRLAARAHGGDVRVEVGEEWPTRFVVRLALPEVKVEPPRPSLKPRAAKAAFLD